MLSPEEVERMQRGRMASEFISSTFFQTYLLPYLDKTRFGAYPKPDSEGWEKKYIYTFAKDEAITELLQVLHAWDKEFDALVKKDKEIEKDVILA